MNMMCSFESEPKHFCPEKVLGSFSSFLFIWKWRQLQLCGKIVNGTRVFCSSSVALNLSTINSLHINLSFVNFLQKLESPIRFHLPISFHRGGRLACWVLGRRLEQLKWGKGAKEEEKRKQRLGKESLKDAPLWPLC